MDEKVGYNEMKMEDQIEYNRTKEERERIEKEFEQLCKTPKPTKMMDEVEMNKFEQLVQDIATGELNLTMIGIAISAGISQRKDIPRDVRNLLCGQTGLIRKMYDPIREIIGNMELAFRRGSQGAEK